VDVDRERLSAKFWLRHVETAANFGFSERELRVIERIVLENREDLIKAWNEYFRT
jgi:hypothetical protein